MRDGEHGIKVEAWPFECEACGDDDKELFGCGYSGHAGKASLRYEHGGRTEPWCRTCPRYCWSMPGMQQLHSDLRDYKRAAFGSVLEMEAIHLDLLRVLEAETEHWEAENQKQLRR